MIDDPKTYAEVITNLRIMQELNAKLGRDARIVVSDLRYSISDRQAGASMADMSELQADRLKDLAIAISKLGIAHSSECFDDIIVALGT